MRSSAVIVYFPNRTGPKFDALSARERKLLVDRATSCAACNASLSFWSYGVVDHCHWTGLVRGVVCVACNTRMRRSEEPRIKALGRYLEGVEYEKFDLAFEAQREEHAASIADKRQRLSNQSNAERSYGGMIGAMLLENALLPKYRRGLCFPEGDLERIYRALLYVYDSGDPATSSRVISALGSDPARARVVDLESAALTAESPESLAERCWLGILHYQLACLTAQNETS